MDVEQGTLEELTGEASGYPGLLAGEEHDDFAAQQRGDGCLSQQRNRCESAE